MKRYSKILVPTDFSEHAAEALNTAIDLALRYEASIELLHVFDRVIYPYPEASAIVISVQIAEVEEQLKKDLEKQRQLAVAHGAQRLNTALIHGHPPTEIVKHAKAIAADLIVMGTHGRRGFSHFLIGSVAERVVRTAPCAVLTVRVPSLTRDR